MGQRFIASNCISACLYLYCIVQRGWRLRCKSLFAANNIAFLRASSILERAAEREMDGALNFNQEEAWSDGDLLWSVYFFLCRIQINQSRAHIHILIMWPRLTLRWQSISFPSALLTSDSPTHPQITSHTRTVQKTDEEKQNEKIIPSTRT